MKTLESTKGARVRVLSDKIAFIHRHASRAGCGGRAARHLDNPMVITRAGGHCFVFSEITGTLQSELKKELAQIRFLLKKSPAAGYSRIVEIGREVGRKYGIKLIVNFPKEGRIEEFEMYGRRDLSIIIDYDKKRFPIDREVIKDMARELLGDVKTEDAYMYENKEGVRVSADDWKIDILPHSVHVWTEFTDEVTEFCDWLLENAYGMRASN